MDKILKIIEKIHNKESQEKEVYIDERLKSFTFSMQILRNIYKNFETEENQARISALKEVFKRLEKKGILITCFFGGSLDMGMSEENSDIEIRLIAQRDSNGPELKTLLNNEIRGSMGRYIKIDVWGSPVDLSKLEQSIEDIEKTGHSKDLSAILDIYFGYHISETRFGLNCDDFIERIEKARKNSRLLNNSLNMIAENRLPSMKNFFKNSFRKYKNRLYDNQKFNDLPAEKKLSIISKLDQAEEEIINAMLQEKR